MAAGNKVVVDGSNIATEGRSSPSLAQLDEAVRAYLAEHPNADITVVVDATFGHRIDDSERQLFEEARAAGEMVSPPAGAIGRGDAFLLRIAEKTGATVLSNDSFQEFHGEHDWLFTTGRLIGGVPVAGVGWIFTPRSPVRGPKSRQSVQEAKREQKRRAPRPEAKQKAIAEATEEATEPGGDGRRRRRRRGRGAPSDPLNDPLPFLTFVSAHPLGSELEGEVGEFSSHGAFVQAGEVRCYVPLSALGDPPPRAAREVLSRGETRTFVVQALDPLRRGIELALPGHAHVSGSPTSETVEAEITEAHVARTGPTKRAGRRRPESADAERPAEVTAQKAAPTKPTTKKTAPKKATAKKATAKKTNAKKTNAKKATTKKAVSASAPKATAPKATAKKATDKKAAPKKAAVKSVAKQAVAKKATTKKSTSQKGVTTKAVAKKAATKSGTKAPARKSAAKKTAATKTAASKSTAKKAGGTGAKKTAAKKAGAARR
ncbi:MAG TPA: S1 RNA-binding domain-containing protein [Acidimicrobiales bacterium]|nr:S1 RNA-binding domain-containing protein [Acidimicrobiales bacterium]